MAKRMPRYVEPQIRYSAAKARMTEIFFGAAIKNHNAGVGRHSNPALVKALKPLKHSSGHSTHSVQHFPASFARIRGLMREAQSSCDAPRQDCKQDAGAPKLLGAAPEKQTIQQ